METLAYLSWGFCLLALCWYDRRSRNEKGRRKNRGEDFSLDGIVCSIGDEIGNTEQKCFRENGFDNEIDGANSVDITDEKDEIKEDRGKTVLNNNQSRRQETLSTHRRKRNFSSTLLNEEGSEQESSSPAKKFRQKKPNEDFQSNSFVPSTMRTRQRRNSVMKNSSGEDDNEGATITQQFDISEGESSSLISDSLSNMASSVSLISPFAGIPTTASPTVASVGDFEL